MAHANVAPSIGVDLLPQRIAPTMGYVAQIATITAKFIRTEKWALENYPHSTQRFSKRDILVSTSNRDAFHQPTPDHFQNRSHTDC